MVNQQNPKGLADPWGLSVLIAGCGSIGKRHARVLQRLGVRDLRACDPIAEQRDAVCAQTPSVKLYDDFDAALRAAPDAVWICTPPEMHIPMAMQAIRAGAHVFSEKPLSDSDDGIDDLVALADAQEKKVMVGLCFRYHAGLLRAKKLLDAGEIGRCVSIRALMGEHLPDVRPDYRTLFSAQTTGAFDLMHDIDLALWYAGQNVRAVHAFSGTYSDIGIVAPDVVEILLDFENRCVASVHLDFFQRPRRRQIELIGTTGVMIVEFARWEHCTVSVYHASHGARRIEEMETERDDMFSAEDREFLECVAEDKPIACTIAEASKSLAVVVAARNKA
ncbi:MAG: Gfo/Idh/MocA family oxidoreductase [Chloroflexi bacterium]|nr:Gfo/Idh/MocA family oxidoreductase [Chloroflexota bacterium]